MRAPPTWHGQPLPFNAYPLRPWWRWQHGKGWVRADGRRGLGDRKILHSEIDEISLRHVDEMHPLQAPERSTGQVWGAADAPEMWRDALNPESWPPPGCVLVDGPGAPWAPAATGYPLLIDIETQRDMLRHWTGPVLGVESITPGRYRSPDGVLGTVGEFDAFANCFTFYPDGHKPRAVVGPGFPDGLTRVGKGAAGWVRLGEPPQ